MHFTVYTFNDGYPLYLFLTGLRSYLGSPEWSGLVFLMVSGLTLAGILMVRQISPLGYFKAYAGPLLLYALFFGQTAQIRIQDEWAHEAYTIDNMPVGVVIPLSVCSTVEKVVLDMVETHIMPPDMTSFSDFDFFMEAAALGETLNGKAISHFEALSSVGRYFDDCVLKGIATGFVNERAYYRSGDLLTDSYMPWGVYFTELVNRDGTREVMTCKAAYNRLWGTVKDEAQSVGPAGMADYLSSLFGGRHKNVVDTIMAMDSLASTLFPGHQSTSEALFQQAFMMNGLQSSLARSNPQMLSAISQAEVSQATGIAAASSVYIKKAPKLRAMMKLVIVGMLPLIAAFFLAQSGQPFLHWCAALLSVSLWLPIMAIIKATYVASAINELQGMVLATGGVTLPNKLRLMAWITDTSTVAGTLAFTIPTFAAMMLQMMVPRLAMAVGGMVLAAKGAEGFAQRSGMQALQGAERSARELELDKVNGMFLEAGDTHLARNERMNQLVGGHDNVAFGRNTGASPMQYNGTRTTAIEGQGYAIQGGLDAKTSNSLQQAVAKQQATLHSAHASAAYNYAMGQGTSRGKSEYDRWEQGMDDSQQNQYSDVKQTISGITERVAKSHGFEGEEVAQAQRVLSAGTYAGVDFSSDKQALGAVFEAFTGAKAGMGARGQFNAAIQTGEAERAKVAVQEIADALKDNKEVSSYTQARALAFSDAHRMGTGEEWSQSASRHEGFQSAMQRTDSAWQSLSATKTRVAETQAAFSASAGRNINTGTLLAVTSRADLELIAMTPGMERLHGELHRGVHDIDSLRIAANADTTNLMRRAEKGDTEAHGAVMNVLGVLAGSNQYNAQDARLAMSILDQRAQTSGDLGMTDNTRPGRSITPKGPIAGNTPHDYDVEDMANPMSTPDQRARTADGSMNIPSGQKTNHPLTQPHAQDTHTVVRPQKQRDDSAGGFGMAGSTGKTARLMDDVSHEATLYRNGYASGVDAGQRRLDDNVDTGRLDTGFKPNEALTSKDTFGAETARLAAGGASDRAALDRAAEEVQRDLRAQGIQVVDDVSHLDVNKGTFENTRAVLTGEAADILLDPLGQDKAKALEEALSSLDKK